MGKPLPTQEKDRRRSYKEKDRPRRRYQGRQGQDLAGPSPWRDVEQSITFYHGEAGNTMNNEELAALIQNGERDRLPELWAQVERFVAQQANRRLILAGGLGGVEFGDLYNAGYLALIAAVDSFDPLGGKSFIGWLALALRSAFAEAGGYRSRKQSMDPLHRAGSLDVPVGEDEDSASLAELAPDPAAARAFEGAEGRIYREQLGTVLEGMLAALPEKQSRTLRQRYYKGRTLEQIAAADGVHRESVRQWQEKGLRALRRDWRKLAQFVE